MSKTGVHFPVFIYVGSYHPRTGDVVQVEYCAFADIYEESDVPLASVRWGVSLIIGRGKEKGQQLTSTYAAAPPQ